MVGCVRRQGQYRSHRNDFNRQVIEEFRANGRHRTGDHLSSPYLTCIGLLLTTLVVVSNQARVFLLSLARLCILGEEETARSPGSTEALLRTTIPDRNYRRVYSWHSCFRKTPRTHKPPGWRKSPPCVNSSH